MCKINAKIKGFTLSELVVVLVVLGSITAFTIPAIQKYLMDARCKSAYRKAYSNVQSIISAQYIAGDVRQQGGADENIAVFESLLNNLHIKEFASNSTAELDSGNLYGINDTKTAIEYKDTHNRTIKIGTGEALSVSSSWTTEPSPWMVSEDNMAYSVIGSSSDDCSQKEILNGISGDDSISALEKKSCAIVIVDVNGLSKGPNKIETQVLNGLEEDGLLEDITGDRFYIYIASNGTAQGPKSTTFSGRLLAGLK